MQIASETAKVTAVVSAPDPLLSAPSKLEACGACLCVGCSLCPEECEAPCDLCGQTLGGVQQCDARDAAANRLLEQARGGDAT